MIGKKRSVDTCLHSQADGVHQYEREDRVLEVRRRDQPPNFVLHRRLWYVTSLRLCFQCKFYALSLQKAIL